MTEAAQPPITARLGDIAAAATLIVGGLSAASYAFALGYVFALEPRFLPALSFGDLLLLFVSSTSTAIFAAIALVPSIGMLLTRGIAKRVMVEGEGALIATEDAPPQAEGATLHSRPGWSSTLVFTTAVNIAFGIAVLQDVLIGGPRGYSPLPEFVVTFGIVALLLPFSRSRLVRSSIPLVLAVYALAAFYTVGDITGRRDLAGAATSREMPCAFIDDRPNCYDLLLVGSESIIVRAGGKIILLSRDRLRSVQRRKQI